MKTYCGYRLSRPSSLGGATTLECVVMVRDGERKYPLTPRLDLRNHSPTGFEWGYGGSGPAQLALALAANVLGDDELAQEVYQRLKFQVVSRLPNDGWMLTEQQLCETIRSIQDDDH